MKHEGERINCLRLIERQLQFICTLYNVGIQKSIPNKKKMGYTSRKPGRVLVLLDKKLSLELYMIRRNGKIKDEKDCAGFEISRYLLQHCDRSCRIWCKLVEFMYTSGFISKIRGQCQCCKGMGKYFRALCANKTCLDFLVDPVPLFLAIVPTNSGA